MNTVAPYLIGAGIMLALIIVGWLTRLKIENGYLKNSLIVAQEEVKDAEIDAKNHALTEPELDALLSKDLGDGTKPTT